MKTENAPTSTTPIAEILRGNWNIIKGKLKAEYANLTDNDLAYVEGKELELLGRLQKLTGRTQRDIEKIIRNSCACD
jgi:uncharacterized protein YjbJ (UPF0337 family)